MKTLKQLRKIGNKGNLPFLLFYQSLNEHPVFETHDDIDSVLKRFQGLKLLGRTPVIYQRLKEFEEGSGQK